MFVNKIICHMYMWDIKYVQTIVVSWCCFGLVSFLFRLWSKTFIPNYMVYLCY